jgi:hypothetical protein
MAKDLNATGTVSIGHRRNTTSERNLNNLRILNSGFDNPRRDDSETSLKNQ